MLYRLAQQQAASFIAHTGASTGAELTRFGKDELDAFLEGGILDAWAPQAALGGASPDIRPGAAPDETSRRAG